MVCPSESLRVAVNEKGFVCFADVDSSSAWAIGYGVRVGVLQLCVFELGQDVGMVGAVCKATHDYEIDAGRMHCYLDVFEHTVFVENHGFD
jgi:hypothetical protein